jgi:hypothetical protein
VSTIRSGTATLFAFNPAVSWLLIGITMVAAAVATLALVTAWLGWIPARLALAPLLIALTAATVLSLPSIGLFILPVVALGRIIFALSGIPSGTPQVRNDE